MSRIGKLPVEITDGVSVDVSDKNHVTVKGPKGQLSLQIDPDITVEKEDGQIVVSRPTEQKRHKALHGLTRSLIANMVQGVTEGYTKELEVIGVGYRAEATKVGSLDVLELALGFSHPIYFVPPSGISFEATGGDMGATGFVASVALSILAFKGFTTVTNSGAEVTDPHRNVGRAIIWSIAICVVVYLLVAFAVGSSLPLERIVAAKDYALAEAAEPALGKTGFYLTVALALVATASGLIASVFAVSRMLAMLTDMKMIPHSHFGMPGTIKDHTLVYTVVIAGFLTVFFDLSRIASLGAFFYLVMDMIIHFGVFRHLREEIGAQGWVLLTAIALDAVVLAAFAAMKWQSDPLIVVVGIFGMALVFLFVGIFLTRNPAPEDAHNHH